MSSTWSVTQQARITALSHGWWMRHDGTFIAIRRMPDPYLINALLKALNEQDPAEITEPLAREVVRRGIESAAFAVAKTR